MRNAGLERVRAIRQGARQLPQARPGCGANCPNEGDIVPRCSKDQPLWHFGSARWQIRQSASRHASRRVAWDTALRRPRGSKARNMSREQHEAATGLRQPGRRERSCSFCGLHTDFTQIYSHHTLTRVGVHALPRPHHAHLPATRFQVHSSAHASLAEAQLHGVCTAAAQVRD